MYGSMSATEEEGTFCVSRIISVFTACFESSFLLKDEVMIHAQIVLVSYMLVLSCSATRSQQAFEGEQQHHVFHHAL